MKDSETKLINLIDKESSEAKILKMKEEAMEQVINPERLEEFNKTTEKLNT